MRRFAGSMLLGVVAVLAVSTEATSQSSGPYVFLGGGMSIPTGKFKNEDHARTGWMATAGIGANLKKGAWIEGEVYYGSNKHEATSGEKTNLLGGFAAVGYTLMPTKKVSPFVMGGVGFLNHKFVPPTGASFSDTKLAFKAGGGLSFTISPKASFWIGAEFMARSETALIPITAGFTINFPKS